MNKIANLTFWFMRDNHTFIQLRGSNIYEVMGDAKKISKLNPYGSVCPVTLTDKLGDTKIGIMVHVDGIGNVDLDKWYDAIKENDVIKNFGA